MTTLPDPELLFGDILAYIEQAHGYLAAEDFAALDAINATVDDLAAQLMHLSPDALTDYGPEISYLVTRMTELRDRMQAKKITISETLDISEKRLRAMHAYYNQPGA